MNISSKIITISYILHFSSNTLCSLRLIIINFQTAWAVARGKAASSNFFEIFCLAAAILNIYTLCKHNRICNVWRTEPSTFQFIYTKIKIHYRSATLILTIAQCVFVITVRFVLLKAGCFFNFVSTTSLNICTHIHRYIIR